MSGGSPTAHIDASNDAELDSAIRGGGRFKFQAKQPDSHSVWLGQVKNLYLASVPTGPRLPHYPRWAATRARCGVTARWAPTGVLAGVVQRRVVDDDVAIKDLVRWVLELVLTGDKGREVA